MLVARRFHILYRCIIFSIVTLLFISCKSMNLVSENDLKDTGAGNQEDPLKRMNEAAWFLNENKPIPYCILADETIPETIVKELPTYITQTYNIWLDYIAKHHIQDEVAQAELRFAKKLILSDTCENQVPLRFIFGLPKAALSTLDETLPDRLLPYQSQGRLSAWFKDGGASSNMYQGGRDSGVAWFASHSNNTAALRSQTEKGQRFLNYLDKNELLYVLMHQWGHLLGNHGIPGTIMADNLSEIVLARRMGDAIATLNINNNAIDQEYMLVFPHGNIAIEGCLLNRFPSVLTYDPGRHSITVQAKNAVIRSSIPSPTLMEGEKKEVFVRKSEDLPRRFFKQMLISGNATHEFQQNSIKISDRLYFNFEIEGQSYKAVYKWKCRGNEQAVFKAANTARCNDQGSAAAQVNLVYKALNCGF